MKSNLEGRSKEATFRQDELLEPGVITWVRITDVRASLIDGGNRTDIEVDTQRRVARRGVRPDFC